MVNIFFKSLIGLFIILLITFNLSFWVENTSYSKLRTSLESTYIDFNEQLILNEIIDSEGASVCNILPESNTNFIDSVYYYGNVIQTTEDTTLFFSDLENEKRNYSVLKLRIYLNAIKIKETCNEDYDIVLHFFKDNENREERRNQPIVSAILLDAKKKCGKDLVLVPMAMDLGIPSIDFILEKYGITEDSSILINQEKVVTDVTMEKLAQELKCL